MIKLSKDKSIKVTLGIQKRLERLKKGEFKRKFKVKSLNDVIEKLLDIYDEYVVVKSQFKGIIQTGEIAEKSLTSEVSAKIEDVDICPDCKDFPSCKKSWIRNPKEVKLKGCFVPSNQCYYRSTRTDGNIDCAKDFNQKSKIYVVTKEFCEQCWNRKTSSRGEPQQVKKHEEKQVSPDRSFLGTIQESQRKDALEGIDSQLQKKDRIYCERQKKQIQISSTRDMLDLPCMANVSLVCEFYDQCKTKLNYLMRKYH